MPAFYKSHILLTIAALIFSMSATLPNTAMAKKVTPVSKIQTIHGTISSITGTTLIVSLNTAQGTTTVSQTYIIDASSAQIAKLGAPADLTSVVLGDSVAVQGIANNNGIKALVIIDQTKSIKTIAPSGVTKLAVKKEGFFNRIGEFFSQLFRINR